MGRIPYPRGKEKAAHDPATEKQKERLRQKAQEAGVSSGYMLAMALKADYTPPSIKNAPKFCSRCIGIPGAGNNLNQLAKLRNGGRITQLEEESALATLVRSHLRTHQEIRNALAHGNRSQRHDNQISYQADTARRDYLKDVARTRKFGWSRSATRTPEILTRRSIVCGRLPAPPRPRSRCIISASTHLRMNG